MWVKRAVMQEYKLSKDVVTGNSEFFGDVGSLAFKALGLKYICNPGAGCKYKLH